MIVLRNAVKVARAFGACCALFALVAASSSARAQAGYVHELSGLVSIDSASAKAAPAKAGDTFDAETSFRTGSGGKVTLKFADGQIVALAADSALRVGPYRYVANDVRLSTSAVELMKGEMRFATGLIGATHREGVRITAGNSMLGIQSSGGADFIVAVNPDPQEVGHAVVAHGELSVRTPYGPIHKIASDQYAPWRPGRTLPLPLPAAAAPAVVQAAAAGLWATVLPTNAPVVVASAARTAEMVAAAGPAMAAVSTGRGPAGYVDSVSGAISIQTGSGRSATASVGTTFEAGATFNTGIDGRVVLKFADGQLVVLGPGSILGVGEARYDPGNPKASRTAIDLVNGAMRVVTGNIQVENPEGISITAGASIIDIAHTGPADFTVAVDTKRQEVGVARVTVGEISVHTPYGPIDKIKVEQSSPWGPKTPTTPIPAAAAASVDQAALVLQLSAVPDNAPVVVAPAARAAAAVADANRAQAAASANPGNARLRAEAQAATELAQLVTKTATAATEAVAAKMLATILQDLPPTAAGPALAQVAAVAASTPPNVPPGVAAVTPGAGGTSTGSPS